MGVAETRSLSPALIDWLFARLHALYGRQWFRHMAGAPLADVKAAWAHELRGLSRRPDALAWALDHLPERPPNAIEFRALCRRAPHNAASGSESAQVDPARVAAELTKLGALRDQLRPASTHMEWARRIVARHDAGEVIALGTLKIAQAAIQCNEGHDDAH